MPQKLFYGELGLNLMNLKTFIVSLAILSISTGCSSARYNAKNTQVSDLYMPERIYLERYPTISGSKYNLLVKDVSYGAPLHAHPPVVRANYTIKPNKVAFKNFREKIDKLNVWKWKKSYNSPRTEGWKNRVILIYPDRKLDVSINSRNPENFKPFIEALLQLVEFKSHVISDKEFMKKLNKVTK